MADLNALIAQGYQFQPPPDPFVQYGRMQQLEQGQQTNQLNRMKMQEAQRSMEETNALRRLDPASATYLQDVTRLNPKLGFEFAKSQREAKTADTEGQIKSTKLVADKLALLPDAYRMADTPEAYLAVHKSVHADPVLGPYLQSLGATPEKGLAQLNEAVQTGKFDQLRMGSMQSVSQLLDSMKPVVVGAGSSVYDPTKGTFNQAPAAPAAVAKPPEKLEIMRALGYSMDAAGDAAYEAAKRAAPTVAAPSVEISTMNALGIPVTPDGFAYFQQLKTKPVVVAEPTTNEIKNAKAIALGVGPEGSPAYSREFGRQLARLTAKSEGGGGGGGAAKAPVGFRFTPSGDLEAIPGGPSAAGLTTKEIQKREAVLPQARQAVKTVSNTMSVIGQTVDKLLANPDGINGITGLIGGVTPALTDKARAAKADLEQLKNLAFIQGITELRAASKTGAAVGNVTNREGDRFENLKASLDRSQSKDDLITALKKLKQQADLTSQFMTDAFDETYSYKSAAPSPAGGGALSPAEEAELAQLRKRFGK